jgi:hypothetical protein
MGKFHDDGDVVDTKYKIKGATGRLREGDA